MLKTLTPFVSIIFPKLIIDELLSDMHVSKLILLVVSMVVIGFILKATHEVLKCTIENLSDFLSRHFEVKIGKKSLRLDYQHIEDVTVLNQKEKAWMGMDYSGGVEGLTNDLMEILSSFFILVGVTTIVLSYSPWLALIILITAIITTIFHSKIGAIGRKYFLKLSTINRQFEYVFFELPQFRYGKDVRLYDASSIMEYKGETYRKIMYDHWGQSAKYRNRWHQPQIYITGILDVLQYITIGFWILK
jgi:ABC-type multidrug transport system fused ATPase/permease subunit